MSLAIRITSIKADGQQYRVAFNLVPSGSYVTGGDTLDFTNTTQDPSFIGLIPAIETSQPPNQLDVWSQGGNIANTLFPILGTALNNSKLKITSAFNTELSAGAYPGSITGDKICGEAIFAAKLL